MTIGRICIREVFYADPDESASTVARRMRDENVGTLVVTDEQNMPVGFLTDRDLTVRVLAEDLDPQATTVSEVMTREPVMVPEDLPIETALTRMKSRGMRRVIVVDEDKKLMGLASLDDILELVIEEMKDIGEIIGLQSPH